jgi:hypothetical protein
MGVDGRIIDGQRGGNSHATLAKDSDLRLVADETGSQELPILYNS